MLAALRIERFATIDALEVAFGPGLTVLTGETGAGKSILVDALHLALGGRAQADVVRTGCDEATVEAVFQAAPKVRARLGELGLPDGDELLIRRVVHRAGRSRVWVNGALCTVAVLEQLARRLCDISSQHEHVSLLDPAGHLDLLDAHADLLERRSEVGEAVGRLTAVARERQALELDDSERARRADYLRFQIHEIDELDPKAGEEEALAAERAVLASAAKIQSLAEAAEELLYSGEGAAAERTAAATSRVAELATLDPAFAPMHRALAGALAEVEEAARELAQSARRRREDPERLAALDDRLAALRKLARKHGGDLAAVLARRDAMRQELEGVLGHAERLAELAAAEETARAAATSLAAALSGLRREAAARLSSAIQRQLGKLGMGKSKLELRLEAAPLGPRGADAAELYFSANPGEAPKPLARIASGGELSRVMLAAKRAGAATDPVDIYVFDEVDSGIGGPTAQVVGRMLKEVSRERQVICITHLPQIAAFADRHLAVRKVVQKGRTLSEVSVLEAEQERCQEVARMLGGEELTPIALQHARELLARSATA
ncbi:MAG TPA: DNA repair protein RecN [Myxococcales bacterium]|nr:DNA repair protein RecN [Myxococcales bacterium]